MLQEREFTRVGGSRVIRTQARVVAAHADGLDFTSSVAVIPVLPAAFACTARDIGKMVRSWNSFVIGWVP